MRKINDRDGLTTITIRLENKVLTVIEKESKRQMRSRSNLINVIAKKWADEIKNENPSASEGQVQKQHVPVP